MNVTREVILDLLPLYLANEVSADSKTLVEEYLRSDASLAAWVREHRSDMVAPPPALPVPDLEVRTIQRTRSVLFAERWFFALAIAATAVGLSVQLHVTDGRISDMHLLLRDFPLQLGMVLGFAAVCWTGYFALRRRYAV